jgi:hypothetical protein
VLAVAHLLLVVLAPAELDDADLRVAAKRAQLGGDGGALDIRAADLHLGARADHQHVVERERVADGAVKQLDLQHLTLRHPVLLAAGFDYRKHDFPRNQKRHAVALVPRAKKGRGF